MNKSDKVLERPRQPLIKRVDGPLLLCKDGPSEIAIDLRKIRHASFVPLQGIIIMFDNPPGWSFQGAVETDFRDFYAEWSKYAGKNDNSATTVASVESGPDLHSESARGIHQSAAGAIEIP